MDTSHRVYSRWTRRDRRRALLAVAVVAGLAGCGGGATSATTVPAETSPTAPAVTAAGTVPTSATIAPAGTTATTAPVAPAPAAIGSVLDGIDPCALLTGADDTSGLFIAAGVAGVEDPPLVPTVRHCTWAGTLEDEWYSGLLLQVHAWPDLATLTGDSGSAFVVLPIDGAAFPGVAVVSAPNPDVQVAESVVFIAVDAGDVLVALLPWDDVFPGSAEFEQLLALAVTAAARL